MQLVKNYMKGLGSQARYKLLFTLAKVVNLIKRFRFNIDILSESILSTLLYSIIWLCP
jgi:hypothetical protein